MFVESITMRLLDPTNVDLRSESDVVAVIKQVTGDVDTPQIGIGDDAALVKVGDTWLVLTLDTMVDGVHFVLGRESSWLDVGWKLAASNMSDLAAMGARPLHALVGLATNLTVSSSDIADLYSGIQEALTTFGGSVVGGDTVVSKEVSISMTMVGTGVDPSTVCRLGSARAGDAVAVSGTVGDSRGGLKALNSDAFAADPSVRYLTRRHLRPTPRIDLCHEMVANGIRCATDVSDGLVKDLGKICVASGLVANLDVASVPLSPELRRAFPDRALEFALSGGEDYELLITGDRGHITAINDSLGTESSKPFTIIGEMSEPSAAQESTSVETKVHLRSTVPGTAIPDLENTGWDHWSGSDARTV